MTARLATATAKATAKAKANANAKSGGLFPFGKLRVRVTAKTGNGKNNRRSFDCAVRKGANDFAQDDSFWFR